MDSNEIDQTSLSNGYQNTVNILSKCKITYAKDKEEFKKLREINSKMELELSQSRELEKSHRLSLQSSREMINDLQETVSQLVYLKRDVKSLKDELSSKDVIIGALKKDQEHLKQKHNSELDDLKSIHNQKLDEITSRDKDEIAQMQVDTDTQIAQFTCVMEELRAKIRDMEKDHRDKMNVLVLEYEEKLQRSTSQITQLKDQHAGLVARTDAQVEAYRKRLEEVEGKLKNNEFKEFLAQSSSTPSRFNYPVERPYSAKQNLYSYENDKENDQGPASIWAYSTQKSTNKTPKPPQAQFYGNKTPSVQSNKEQQKGFNIVKKRKLYSQKDNLE